MRGSNTKGRAVRLLVGLGLVGALLPAYGPLVDHHFFERLPGHAHTGGTVPFADHVR